MKFLDPRFENRNLMPIHVMSYDSFELGARDALAITFKDMDTQQVFVETIDKPKYEIYVVKPELRSTVRYMKSWMDMGSLDKYLVSYHNRDAEIAEILGCRPADVKISPWVYGYDQKIEEWYWIQFILEYGNDQPKKINPGFFDIESDIIQADGFAAPGEAPTSAITLIDANEKQVYTLALCCDNLPILAETNPDYPEIQKIKENFYEQVDYLKNHTDEFIVQLHEMFDESYGADLTYNLILFDDEIKLHQVFWEIVRRCNLDYLMAWNAPYDIRNLIERPLSLGYEPEAIICDPAFKYKTVFFEEDDNIQVHKRNHRAIMAIKPLPMCMMWLYAGVRSAEGKQPSLKLNAIGKKELKDEKLNYEEEGNIKTFMYKNLWKYLIYNIKDVLLMLGIHRVTKDIDGVYDRCYDNGMLIPEAFVSTTTLTTSLTKFFLQNGFVLGTNEHRVLPPFDFTQYIADTKVANVLNTFAQDESIFDDPDDIPDEEFDEGMFEGGDDY